MEQLDNSRGAPPLYLQISEILKKRILSKTYAYNEIIPSELELQKLYSVSRTTARQAIQELEKEGLVTRARGKGTVVSYKKQIEEHLSRIKSFTDEMKERQIEPGTAYAHIEVVSADEHLAEIFQIEVKSPLFRLERVRTGDGEPIVVFVSYFSIRRNLPLDDSLYRSSIYEMLSAHGIRPVKIKEKLDCMMPDTRLKQQLNITKTLPIFRRIRQSYDNNGELIEYTRSYYRADKYAYYIEIEQN